MSESSFFLFGPRGTGKSTWISQKAPNATVYDLLDQQESLRLERDPNQLYRELSNHPPGSWIVLDEVQKVPALMDEVHRLIEQHHVRFILCGSSARKLKRSGANLLAGRALVRHLFPLTSSELQDSFDVEKACIHGTLPLSVLGTDPVGFLQAYSATYLNEEIRAEALTRNIGAFSRFLEIAARQHAQVTNASNIAREAGVTQSTVRNYFQILADTLIGYWIRPWKRKPGNRQVSHPKFYLFDPGVARALTGRLPYPPTQEEMGPLLESLIINEIRAFIEYSNRHYELFFWRNYDGAEVDVLCETQKGFVAIEIKAAKTWQRRFNRGLKRFMADTGLNARTYGVCLCERRSLFDNVQITPVHDFLRELWSGRVIE